MANKILEFVLLITIINIFVFYTISTESPSLSLNNPNPWGFVTFQFTHFNLTHLLQNIIGLIITAVVAIELKLGFKDFLLAYFLSIFLILPLLMLFPNSVIAGNSTGIYGVIALSLMKANKFFSDKITIPIFIALIFSFSMSGFITCGSCALNFFKADIFHFVGFLGGLIAGHFINIPKRK